jgi:hypothetical protein
MSALVTHAGMWRRYLLSAAEFLYFFEDALALCVVAGGSQRLGAFLRGGN